jgi:hypothetical protein
MDPTWLGNALPFVGLSLSSIRFPAAKPANVGRTLRLSINAKAALSISAARLSTRYAQLS